MTFPLVTLVILDGWGIAPPGPGNAVELASTPVFDALVARYPHTQLEASGPAVGLPEGQMGNSEVGHLTIGSGRVLFQDLVRVSRAIEDGSFFGSEALAGAFRRARERGGAVHLAGLVSHGGVHSHLGHFLALVELARREGMAERTWIHAFTDGRDVSPTSAVQDLRELPAEQLATVCGRYYAMDRDQRWERTDLALAALLHGEGTAVADADGAIAAVERSYAEGVTDEFLTPIVVAGTPRIDPAVDSVVFVNFRPDRARQLSYRLLALGVDLTTMTRYAEDIDCPVVFDEQEVDETLAEILSRSGARQLHVAETEKYAHVTYFFNGGREEEWEGETRILVPSPRDVPSYDHRPAMSAPEVARRFSAEIGGGYRFAVINFANPDMVGHTGVIPAVVAAVEEADRRLGEVIEATARAGGVSLVTADHGNAECMLAEDGVRPHTAHTTNPVPLVVTVEGAGLTAGGELSGLAPTILELLGLPVPAVMTGRSLLAEAIGENR
jgi:2,3-bisphosphoglycerate-independent phosphoglycerate mutase